MKKLTLTRQILLGLVLGIAVGWLAGPERAAYFRPFSQIFLRLVKMLIAPLIFSSLVAGIAGAGHPKVVGRMGLRALVYFEVVVKAIIAGSFTTRRNLRSGIRSPSAIGSSTAPMNSATPR